MIYSSHHKIRQSNFLNDTQSTIKFNITNDNTKTESLFLKKSDIGHSINSKTKR